MTDYLGDYPVNATIQLKWSTNGQDGASITRSTDGTLKIYKGSSTTERTSLAGVTQTEDFDAATGIHHVTINLSDDTDAGFYAAGNEYQVVMTGMTIDTKTVNAVLASFSIERAGGALALLKDATFGLSALETLTDDLESRLTATRAGYLDNLSAGAVALSTQVDALEGDSTAIKAKTDQLAFTTGNVHSHTKAQDNLALTTQQKLDVNTEADTALGDVGLTPTVTGRLDASVSTRASQTSVDMVNDLLDTEFPALIDIIEAGVTLTSGERNAMATAFLDLANGVETGKSVRKALQAMAAVLAGDATGAGTGMELFKALGNSGTTRVTVPADSLGNRKGVTTS